MEKPLQVVIDTNVVVSSFRSKLGASHFLLAQLGSEFWRMNVSTGLLFEYEEQLVRLIGFNGLTRAEVYVALDTISRYSRKQKVSFLLRPNLPDPDDEMILDLAACARATYIVTHNKKDFPTAKRYGIEVVTPGEFLNILRK